jgi:hypothetical protein
MNTFLPQNNWLCIFVEQKLSKSLFWNCGFTFSIDAEMYAELVGNMKQTIDCAHKNHSFI